MTTSVSVTDYRANLAHWHDVAASGEEVLVTDRGRVVVRVVSAEPAVTLDLLEREGLLRRGGPRPPADELETVPAPGDSMGAVSRARDR